MNIRFTLTCFDLRYQETVVQGRTSLRNSEENRQGAPKGTFVIN